LGEPCLVPLEFIVIIVIYRIFSQLAHCLLTSSQAVVTVVLLFSSVAPACMPMLYSGWLGIKPFSAPADEQFRYRVQLAGISSLLFESLPQLVRTSIFLQF